MEILDFTPFKNVAHDCYQNNIISIIRHYYNRDYTPIFWAGFEFEYLKANKSDIKLDDFDLNGCNRSSEKNILHDICGIRISESKNYTYSDFKSIFHNKISNNEPIGIHIDSFHLPWNNYYKQKYRSHYILACGMKNSNTIICYDGFIAKELHSMSIDDLFNNYDYIILYENIGETSMELQDCWNYFRNIIFRNNPKNLII